MNTPHSAGIWSGLAWLNAPSDWSVAPDETLHAVSGPRTDFWQSTFYGFRRDDGHAFLRPVDGAFTAKVSFEGDYEHLYDQAGLMIRSNAENWIKLGVEWTDAAAHLSVVVTRNGLSDWSAQPFEKDGSVAIRVTRINSALILQWLDDGTWRMLRLAPSPEDAATLHVGPYLCSPEREGFRARFSDFEIGEPQVRQLHE